MKIITNKETTFPCSDAFAPPGKSPARLRKCRKKGGWLLMEVVIALGIFSTAVVSFIVVLNQVAELSLLTRQESMVSRLIEGALMEALTVPEIKEEKYEYQLDETDMVITVDTSPITLVNKDQSQLEDMWLVKVTARWMQNGEPSEETVETWRYGKLYQP